MHKKIISFDPGTGGNKAYLYDLEGNCLVSAFVPYSTHTTPRWNGMSSTPWIDRTG